MGFYGSLVVLMRPFGFLGVTIGLYEFLLAFMCPYWSLFVLMSPCGLVCVFMLLHGS